MHTLTAIAGLGLAALAVLALPGGSIEDDPRFVRGRALFDHAFHLAEGIGSPDFNADSCRACHSDPSMGGAGPLELNVSRFGNENLGVFTDLPGGQSLSKLRAPNAEGREEYSQLDANCFEQRQTPTLFGVGLIDGIFEASILANADPNDANSDGIRGRARFIDVNGVPELGRFGWKNQLPRLRDFVKDALMNELGITSADDGRGLTGSTDADGVADPEITTDAGDLGFFIANLPRPARGGSTDPRVAQGEAVFTSVGCALCHVPSLDGASGPVPLFSDLLLHNIMPANFRGMAEPDAPMGWFRTPPLWGISHTAPYLHDGRAEDLKKAILAHDGEAATVRTNYLSLSAADAEALTLFLEDL